MSVVIVVIWSLLSVILVDFLIIIVILNELSLGVDLKFVLFKFDLDFGLLGVFNMVFVLIGFVLLNIVVFGFD